MVTLAPIKKEVQKLGVTGPDKPIVSLKELNQPSTTDFVKEAQKLGTQALTAQKDILRQDVGDISEQFLSTLGTRNITPEGGLGKEITTRAIGEQAKRLEPIAGQIASDIGMQALQQKQANVRQAVDLAIKGQLTGEGAEAIVSSVFGPGVKITTQDERDLQTAAVASGLTQDEFLLMKRSIGTAQFEDIMANPQDYVESPAKIRAFQRELAQMQADAIKEAGRSTAGATREAGGLQALGDVATTLLPLLL